MAKVSKTYAEELYEVELEISKEIQAAEENPQRNAWVWEVPITQGWITREFRAFTSYGDKWSVYRLGLRLSDMRLVLDTSNTCWHPTSANFEFAFDRAYSSIMRELNAKHSQKLQEVLNHRFSTLVLDVFRGEAKAQGRAYANFYKGCWLGDFMLDRYIKASNWTTRIDLRGCVLRDLLRNNAELLSAIAEESMLFYKGMPQKRNKERDLRIGFFAVKVDTDNRAWQLRAAQARASEYPTCLPSWIFKIQEKRAWCRKFLMSVRPELLDLTVEDLKEIFTVSSLDSFLKSYSINDIEEYKVRLNSYQRAFGDEIISLLTE